MSRGGICADHFNPESFTDDSRTSLRHDAVPMPYSSTETQTEGSTNRTINRKLVDSHEAQKVPRPLIQRCEDPVSASKKEIPVRTHLTDAVKTLRKVKMIKIEKQCSNSNKPMVLERCKNPETCPASRQINDSDSKARPHFHKVFINKAEISQEAEETDERVLEGLKESCKSVAISTVLDEKAPEVSSDKMYLTERYLINITKPGVKKDISCTMTYGQKAFGENSQKLRSKMLGLLGVSVTDNEEGEKCEQAKIRVPEHIQKKHTLTNKTLDKCHKKKNCRQYDYCVYRNCKNGKFSTGSRLFRFPQSTDPRANIWIKNAANPRITYWSASTLRSAGLCADHFSDDMFLHVSRQRLVRYAIPKPYLIEKDVDVNKINNSILIDLPDEEVNNRNEITIKYPFEDTEISISDGYEEAMEYPSFASVMIQSESIDLPKNRDSDRLSMTSDMIDIKDEIIEDIEEDPLYADTCSS